MGITPGIIAAGVGAAGSVASSAMGGSGGGSSQSASNAPWAPQQPYLTQGFQDAQNVYNQRQASGPYTGNFVAGTNPYINAASNNAQNYIDGVGNGMANSTAATSWNLQQAGNPYQQNASQMAQGGIAGPNAGMMGTLGAYASGQSQAAGANPMLSSALNNAAVQGANALGQFSGTLAQDSRMGMMNPTQQIEANAQSYANSPQVQQALSATNSAINQTLNEQTLPQVDRNAAAEGGLNSTRAAMSEGMARQGAATAEGQADASIQNNAYNQGLGTAANLYSSGLNSSINAATLGYNANASNANTNAALQQGLSEYNAGNQLNAANAGLSQGLGYEMGNANTQLGANAQLGNAASLGLQGAGQANNIATSNYSLGANAGNLAQTQQQNGLTNALDQWSMQNTYGQNILQNYMQDIQGNYGSQSTGQSSLTLPPNYLGGALGGALGGYQIANMFGGDGSTFQGVGNGLLSSDVYTGPTNTGAPSIYNF